MSKDSYVYSTLSADQEYTSYNKGGADLPVREGSVFIAGGANVANKNLITPRGVVTKVSPEQLAMLETNDVFNLHKENGFIVVSEAKEDGDVVAAGMEGRSPDSPLVPEDYDPKNPGAKPTGLGAADEGKGAGNLQASVGAVKPKS